MGRLSKLRIVDPVLTNLAIGYTNAEFIGQTLMPIVEVEKEGGKIPKFGKESFRLYQTERALRAKSNRMNPEDIGSVDVNLDEHDLEYPIDYREDQESAFPLEQAAVQTATDAIQLRREKMVADLAQNPSSYASGNKKQLSATEKFTAAGSDPVGVIEDGKEAIRTKIGRRPNTMVIGASAYKTLKAHPQLIEKIKYSMKGIVTVDLLKEIFEVENIAVGEAIYADDKDRFTDIWGANDNGHFSYRAMSGDCSIIAKIDALPTTHKNARAYSMGVSKWIRPLSMADTQLKILMAVGMAMRNVMALKMVPASTD